MQRINEEEDEKLEEEGSKEPTLKEREQISCFRFIKIWNRR